MPLELLLTRFVFRERMSRSESPVLDLQEVIGETANNSRTSSAYCSMSTAEETIDNSLPSQTVTPTPLEAGSGTITTVPGNWADDRKDEHILSDAEQWSDKTSQGRHDVYRILVNSAGGVGFLDTV